MLCYKIENESIRLAQATKKYILKYIFRKKGYLKDDYICRIYSTHLFNFIKFF